MTTVAARRHSSFNLISRSLLKKENERQKRTPAAKAAQQSGYGTAEAGPKQN